ncbi:MAG: methionine--tRNA ligase, partial [archaeon]
MNNKNKTGKRLVTAALPYINNVPHLGHIVGSHLPADIFARYCRLIGHETLFVGGSDDNGTPAVLAAKEIGVDIEKFEDVVFTWHKKVYDWFNISYDNFSRTSRPIHHETTVDFFKKIQENGFITKGKLNQYFCEKDERFLPDRYIKGSCPNCGASANGDQCEKCGRFIETKDLVSPECALCGSVPKLKESKHLFLALDKLSDKISDWLETKEGTFRPQVLNLARGWIKEGLRPRCITRDLEQGIKVPVKGFEDKVFYVWFDAPIGYISATKEATPDRWEEYWKNPKSQIYHFLGKDNIPFHTIFWPGMLIANQEFNLPTQVVGLQYLNLEGGKFSKSQKRGIFCDKLLESDLNPDVLRAYSISVIPESNDTEFKWADLQRRTNDDLIGTYANFFNRTLSFINNKCNGKLRGYQAELTDVDRNLLEQIPIRVKEIEDHLEKAEIRDAYSSFLALAKEGNRYFDYTAPWKLIKEDPDRTDFVLGMCAEVCRVLA